MKFFKKLASQNRPEIPSSVSSSFSELIQKCWSQNPSDRPTCDKITKMLRYDSSITSNLIEKRDYENYIEYLDEYQVVFKKSQKCISIEEFIASKMNIFATSSFVNDEPDDEEQSLIQKEKIESTIQNKNNILFDQANRIEP